MRRPAAAVHRQHAGPHRQCPAVGRLRSAHGGTGGDAGNGRCQADVVRQQVGDGHVAGRVGSVVPDLELVVERRGIVEGVRPSLGNADVRIEVGTAVIGCRIAGIAQVGGGNDLCGLPRRRPAQAQVVEPALVVPVHAHGITSVVLCHHEAAGNVLELRIARGKRPQLPHRYVVVEGSVMRRVGLGEIGGELHLHLIIVRSGKSIGSRRGKYNQRIHHAALQPLLACGGRLPAAAGRAVAQRGTGNIPIDILRSA